MFGAQERLALRKFKFMKLVFSGWKNLVRRLHELHPCVFRKLVAWHAYTKRRIVHNRLMTSCFLPIFTRQFYRGAGGRPHIPELTNITATLVHHGANLEILYIDLEYYSLYTFHTIFASCGVR